MKTLYIVGAGGHGRVVADIARLNGYDDIRFLDDAEHPELKRYVVVGSTEVLSRVSPGEVFIAVGDNFVRERLFHQAEELGWQLPKLIHPKAVLADSVTLGKGVAVMAGAVVNPDAVIEDGCILNTGATVDHDDCIGAFSHVSVGAHLAGTVRVGRHVCIGAGAVVKNNCSITSNCVVGAGAVVVKNIEDAGVYVGVPVKLMKTINYRGGVVAANAEYFYRFSQWSA